MTRRATLIVTGLLCVLPYGCGDRDAIGPGADPGVEAASPLTTAELPPKGQLSAYPVEPIRQQIELRIDPAADNFSGFVAIDIDVSAVTERFALYAEEMDLARVELHDEDGVVELETRTGDDGLLFVLAPGEIAPGRYRLEIEFSRPYEKRAVGLYHVETAGEDYLFTQFQSVDARKAFPCWDEPSFKIPFGMSIHAPETDTVLFNTPPASVTTNGGWTTHVFAETEPMSTYFLAIAAGPFDSIPIEGMDIPGRIYTVRGQANLGRTAAEMTPGILAALEDYFDRPYPYRKLDYVAVPEFWPGAMENAGLVTYIDRLLLIDPEKASVSQRRTLASVIAHELAHMWFGDLVTMTWWDDLWLNESFASWMASKIVRRLYPEYRIELAELRATEYALQRDARPSTKPIRKTITEPSQIMEDLGLAYYKGQAVLEMAEAWIGADAFREGVLAYIEANAWGNAEAGDLWGALTRASGEDVEGMLDGFLTQPGVPLLSFEASGSTGVTVSQSRFLNAGVEAEPLHWVVPVSLRYYAGDERSESFLLAQAAREVVLGEGVQWFLPNARAHGYYRWELPREELMALAKTGAEVLSPRERIAFLGNTRGLLQAGRMAGGDYLEILMRFGSDPDPDVVLAVVNGLDAVRVSFVPDEQLDGFAAYVRATLEPALERFGMRARPGESETVSVLRAALISQLGIEGRMTEIRDFAREQTEAFMQDPRSVEPGIVSAVLGVSAWTGGRELFERFREKLEKASSPVERSHYLMALGAFRDSELRRAALDYAISDAVRVTEWGSVVWGMPETEAAQADVWNWIRENYEEITTRVPADSRATLVSFAASCSLGDLETAREFFAVPERNVPGVDAQLEKLDDRVSDCARLREREGASVAAYLEGL